MVSPPDFPLNCHYNIDIDNPENINISNFTDHHTETVLLWKWEWVVLCIFPLHFPSSDEKRTKLTFVQICAMWENKVKLGRKLNLGATVINGWPPHHQLLFLPHIWSFFPQEKFIAQVLSPTNIQIFHWNFRILSEKKFSNESNFFYKHSLWHNMRYGFHSLIIIREMLILTNQ